MSSSGDPLTEDNVHSPPAKKIRSQPPDIVVAVGTGDSMREYQCYKVVLSFASEYFDAMLSADMKERDEGRIAFPNNDPDGWELFYKFIDPWQLSGGTSNNAPKIDEDNAMMLLPWFHEHHMTDRLKECDTVLSRGRSGDMMRRHPANLRWREDGRTQRQSYFKEVLEVFQMADYYNLETLKALAVGFFVRLLELHDGGNGGNPDSSLQFNKYDLFDLPSIKALVPLVLPLEQGENGLKSRGASRTLWKSFVKILGPHTICIVTPEIVMNNKDLLPTLIYSSMQKEFDRAKEKAIAKAQLVEAQKMVKSSTVKIFAMKIAINSWIENSPVKLYSNLPNKKSMKDSKIDNAASDSLRKLIHDHFGRSDLGITVPESYGNCRAYWDN